MNDTAQSRAAVTRINLQIIGVRSWHLVLDNRFSKIMDGLSSGTIDNPRIFIQIQALRLPDKFKRWDNINGLNLTSAPPTVAILCMLKCKNVGHSITI